MSLKRKRGSNASRGLCKLAIENDITIYTISSLKSDLSKEIDAYDRFELDLSGVSEIDTAGIQLLLAFRSTLTQKKKKLKITALSDVVVNLVNIYGVSDEFILGDTA